MWVDLNELYHSLKVLQPRPNDLLGHQDLMDAKLKGHE
jgi:hypothetical protein